MKQIRVAIIGQGRSGRFIHAEHLVTDPEHYKIVAVTDPLEDRRKRAVNDLKCDTYPDHRELLKRNDIDVVINASPSHLHAPITNEFLTAGFNVLCEKPIAKTPQEVDELIRAARRSRKLFAIFQQSRYAPFFQQILKVIESGVLGRIVQISGAWNGFARRWDWQTLQEFNGGNLSNTGPHPVDQLLCLFGDGMPKVQCFMDRANTFGDAEDYVKLVLSGPGKPVTDLEISSCCSYPKSMYNIQGTRGGLKADWDSVQWKYYLPEEAPARQLIREPIVDAQGNPTYCSEQLTWHEESWKQPEGDVRSNNTTACFYDMLYRTVAEGKPLEITPQQVRRQIAVIEKAKKQNPQIYKQV